MANNTVIKSLEAIENSIEALESRNAFQDDVIEKLNEELGIHQAEISNLKAQLSLLANRIKENTPENNIAAVEPPPPHY